MKKTLQELVENFRWVLRENKPIPIRREGSHVMVGPNLGLPHPPSPDHPYRGVPPTPPGSEKNSAYRAYEILLKVLHELNGFGEGASRAADILRDEMDDLFQILTDEEVA